MTNKDNKKVGYKKPPKKTQWKKGQSGNPKGRPKKSDKNSDDEKAFLKIFKEEMNQTIPINTPNGREEISTKRALMKCIIEKALKDKHDKSIAKLIDIFTTHFKDEEDTRNQNISINFIRDPNPDTRTAADVIKEMREE